MIQKHESCHLTGAWVTLNSASLTTKEKIRRVILDKMRFTMFMEVAVTLETLGQEHELPFRLAALVSEQV